MLIKSLEEMQTIVENNESLSWESWDVVYLKPSSMGWLKNNGKYVNGKWYEATVFVSSEQGWDIPSKLVKKNVK
jgi:hypothetical protein